MATLMVPDPEREVMMRHARGLFTYQEGPAGLSAALPGGENDQPSRAAQLAGAQEVVMPAPTADPHLNEEIAALQAIDRYGA